MSVSGLLEAVGLRHHALGLQNSVMRGRGLGWKAARCLDAASCELHLCTPDDTGRHWHPEDPLAFAKWRVRADLEAVPAHVVVRTELHGLISTATLRCGAIIGALGLSSTAVAALAYWLTRPDKKQPA